MNDRSIPFIREYGEWAILAAAKKSAAGWRKRRYHDHTMEVPENKRYLAVNSTKRNPNAPRGARFPAHPSKQGQTSTPDDDDDDGLNDERIPILPPGPSTTTPARFLNEGVGWDSGLPPHNSTHPAPSSSQLPLSGVGSFPRSQAVTTPSVVPWRRNFSPSGTSTNASYWEHPPHREYAGIPLTCSICVTLKSIRRLPSSRHARRPSRAATAWAPFEPE